MIATTLDPDGRRVHLAEARWQHIKERRPHLARRLGDIMSAVREPDRRVQGRTPGEEWFFAAAEPPRPWLQVVVHYEGGEGWVATAFPRRRRPR